jgi:hypothetical protein
MMAALEANRIPAAHPRPHSLPLPLRLVGAAGKTSLAIDPVGASLLRCCGVFGSNISVFPTGVSRPPEAHRRDDAMLSLLKRRELRGQWQRACELLLAEADVGELTKALELALFY